MKYLINDKNQVVLANGEIIWSCSNRKTAVELAQALELANTDVEYGLQVKLQGLDCWEWHWIKPTGGAPYRFKTKEEAENALRLCFDVCRSKHRVQIFN